jgi:glycosyltransferase involved in cell wall biosynthesis
MRRDTPRVSVVIPAYNNARDIEATLRSVLQQDFEDFEVVIADHCSIDGTAEVIAKFADDQRVRILAPTPIGGGAKANWSRVSEHARGEFIKLLCGDDLITPDALRKQVAAFDASPDAVLVACRRNLVDAAGRQLFAARGLAGLRGYVGGPEAVRASILAGTNIFGEPGCVMMRRKVFEQVGGWDDRFPYLIDQASYSRVMMQGGMVAIDAVQASFRISATQWSVRLVQQQSNQAIAFHEDFFATYPGLLSRSDLRRGNRRAKWMAYARRLAYIWLRRRM